MQNFLICFNSIAPVFLLIVVGTLLKKTKVINADFTDKATDLVFKFVLPVSIFADIAFSEIEDKFDVRLVSMAVIATVLLFAAGILLAKSNILTKEDKSRAAIAQGIFRSNYAILGIPITKVLFDESVAFNASVILAICIPLFNIFSVILIECLVRRENGLKKTFVNIIKNPILIGAVTGGIFSVLKIPVPEVLQKTIGYIGDMCMPLALITIGASLVFNNIKKTFKNAFIVSFIRTFIAPVIFLFPAYYFGIQGEKLGVLFIFLSAPAAISGYIMMRKMGGDYDLAGNIVLLSTALSFFSILIGISVMKTMGLI